METTGFKRTTQQDVAIAAKRLSYSNHTGTGQPGGNRGHQRRSARNSDANREIGSSIEARKTQDLPVIDGNNEQLTQLESGITPPTPALDLVTTPNGIASFSTNGQAATVNMFSVDGAMNWELCRGSEIRVAPVA